MEIRKFGADVLGLVGEMVRAGDVKVGDTIVPLESQSDLGRAAPVIVAEVTRHGATQVTLASAERWAKRTSIDTLVFLVFTWAAPTRATGKGTA